MLQTQYHAKPQILRFDNETEFVNSAMQQFMFEHGKLHQTCRLDTPQQHGIAERKK